LSLTSEDNCLCARAVGWATSISEAYATYVYTHVHGGVAPGVVMRSGRAWAGSLGCKPLDAERRIGGVPYSPVGMQRALGMCGWVRGGSEGQQGGRGSPRSCGGDSRRGWAVGWATSVSETHTIYMHTYVHGGVAPGIVTQSSRGFRGVSDYLPSNTLKLMVLTSVYAEDLDNAPVDV